MRGINKNLVMQAAIAAAFSAGFNSDWFKGQFAALKREADFGGMRPYVPLAVGAGLLYFMTRGR